MESITLPDQGSITRALCSIYKNDALQMHYFPRLAVYGETTLNAENMACLIYGIYTEIEPLLANAHMTLNTDDFHYIALAMCGGVDGNFYIEVCRRVDEIQDLTAMFEAPAAERPT